ncbi:NUDIX domain-containing protein [Urbifossiella limnaea]|uniref:NUDIX hydrolase n=1 Tax=Urbifossiella limnaea TaxID=2528023 RepID=A0A517XN58_9BACT|nr:NUDIX domain-containing protein [Urbifossiella limnaea]QDU18938.1 hypothetical protein ETAA1_08360 [Urbifossiella limnaea]
MAEPFPVVDVAVVLIADPRGERLLADFNPDWGSFTLPMSKVAVLPPASPGAAPTAESPARAAARAAAEVFGRPVDAAALVKLHAEVPPYQQSGRDGEWKRYRYHLFASRVGAEPRPLPGHVAVWLTPAEFTDHEPVSETARHVLAVMSLADVRRAVGM